MQRPFVLLEDVWRVCLPEDSAVPACAEVSSSHEASVSHHVEKWVFFPLSCLSSLSAELLFVSDLLVMEGEALLTHWVLYRLLCVCPPAELLSGPHMPVVTLKSQSL